MIASTTVPLDLQLSWQRRRRALHTGARLTDVGEHATEALRALDSTLQSSIDELTSARARVETVLRARENGSSWRDICHNEQRPLIVESVTTVLDQLSAVGSRFRRAQAKALHHEGLSMERVAALFGVTRQRVSALLRDREAAATTDAGS